MRAVPFGEYGSATAAGDGTATVYVRGPRIGRLQIGQVVLQATAAGGSTGCTAELYRSAELPGLLLGQSLVADADTLFGAAGDELSPGDQLVVAFAGCAPGTTCNVNMRGTEYVDTYWR